MTEAQERADRDARLRAEPGEPPTLADQRTAAAYRREIERLMAAQQRKAG